MPDKGRGVGRREVSQMRKPRWDNVWSFDVLVRIADACQPWLPIWVVWLLFIPFVVTVIVSCIVELAIRFAITPTKYYQQ